MPYALKTTALCIQYNQSLRKIGDKILTIGGIYGTIFKINEDGTLIIAVEDGGKLRIAKSAVSNDATAGLNPKS